MTFSIHTRKETIQAMQQEELDLLIIGGGITGAGVALQAAASGVKTGLIEMQDFAEGTSSRSTKLVHGGIRYLKNFDVEVVADTVTERAVIQSIAPHIPKPDPMLLPIYNDEGPTTYTMFSVKIAMDLYDKLANVTGTSFENYVIDPEEVLKREPYLKKEGLQGAGVYLDFRNNDARLVIENIKQAADDGGYMVSKMNTSGPWVDKVRNLNFTRAVVPKMRPTKGVHLVVDRKKLPVPQPTYFDTGKHDGRMVFAIPRENKTYFGTTDTDYNGDFEDPKVTQEDVDYLLDVINHRYPEAKLTLNDIEASWAGLRPLLMGNAGSDYNGGDNGSISEKSFDEVIEVVTRYRAEAASRDEVEHVLNHLENSRSEKELSPSQVSRGSSLEREEDGLITLSGGKITDYRKMAAGAMKLIQQLLKDEYNQEIEVIDSKHYPVSGGHFDPATVDEHVEMLTKQGVSAGLPEEEARYIADFYGSNAQEIFKRAQEEPFPGLSAAESGRLRYALEAELSLTPADYLMRRTNHILFERDTLDNLKQPVVDAMAEYLAWDEAEKQRQQHELDAVIAESDLSELKAGMN